MPRTSNPEKKVVADCPVCGKEFSFYKSWPVKTCSMECRDRLNHPDAKTTTQCPECGKEFAHYKAQPRKFCSNECSGKNTVSNIQGWQPSAFKTNCEQCGKQYTTTPKATRGRFCSRSCFADWMKEHAPSGPDNPKFGKKYGRRFGDFANYREANHEDNLVSLCPICHLVVEPRRADS